MRHALALFLVLVGLPAFAQPGPPSRVLASSHSFSAGGRGRVTSSDARACVFCHFSHGAEKETLWNQRQSTASYTPYDSPSMDARGGSPSSSASKLCLSCHDGTVAVGTTVAKGRIPVAGAMAPTSVTGTDLSGHHPIGIRPVDDGQVFPGLAQTPPVSADPAVRLPGGTVECTSCHDPHVEDNDPVRFRFLVQSNAGGALCLACHDASRPDPSSLRGWVTGAHATASHSRSELYGSVRVNACGSCHMTHQPNRLPGSPPLLRAVEEAGCLVCHGGSGTTPALPSVEAELKKAFAHPVLQGAGLHSATENAYPLNDSRHAECPDCHNAHAARAWTAAAIPPAVAPPLQGATGVDASGQGPSRPARNEHDVCFKCHAGSSNKPQGPGYVVYGYTAARQTDLALGAAFDTRAEFTSSVARHNVVLPRRQSSAEVPSLRANMLTIGGSASGRSLGMGTYIYCSDCHNSDEARSAGGSKASGAHGSAWPHILERRYATEPPPAVPGGAAPGVAYQSGTAGTAALCAKCHDVDGSVLEDRSFKAHKKHVAGERTACATCHDSHGISGGGAWNNRSLINFDVAIVGPSSSGILRFEGTGVNSGRCYLRCHGRDHNPLSY